MSKDTFEVASEIFDLGILHEVGLEQLQAFRDAIEAPLLAQIAMLIPGLDEHWVTTQEGKQALSATSAGVEAWLRERDEKILGEHEEQLIENLADTGMLAAVTVAKNLAELRKNGG